MVVKPGSLFDASAAEWLAVNLARHSASLQHELAGRAVATSGALGGLRDSEQAWVQMWHRALTADGPPNPDTLPQRAPAVRAAVSSELRKLV